MLKSGVEMGEHDDLVLYNNQKIAYFSMEIGLTNEIPTYCGGLGVLAGDIIKTSADLNFPLVAVTLISKKGYFKQDITECGKTIENPDEWDPSKFMRMQPSTVHLKIQNRDVKIKTWLHKVKGLTGGTVTVLFLDTDVEGNTSEDREITHFLYGGDERYRLKQEIVLGIGGVRMLDALGFKIRRYHMNEGHSSLVALELLRKYGFNLDMVRDLCVFTLHTPVEGGHDKFPYNIVAEIMGDYSSLEFLKELGGHDRLDMTRLALNLSNYINGVAKKHRDTSIKMFKGYEIHAITNGVHSYTWTCESFKKLFDKYLPGWTREAELLIKIDVIPDEKIWLAHGTAKKALVDYINETTNVSMDYDTLTIGFARRATGYKRAGLIFSDLNKLKRVNEKGQIQLVFSGKAHLKDESGKKIIQEIFNYSTKLNDKIKIVYLRNYDMELASKLTSGVDVWLNTPLPPLEASGTSGMKGAHNGVLNFSVLDGWWVEACIEGVTGWAIGPDYKEQITYKEREVMEIEDLYNKLEYIIIPTYYKKRKNWVQMMKNSIGKIASYFNTHRMLRQYITDAYF